MQFEEYYEFVDFVACMTIEHLVEHGVRHDIAVMYTDYNLPTICENFYNHLITYINNIDN